MTHYVVIHAMMMSWYARRRPGNPTVGSMMDLDPQRSPHVAKVVEEAYVSSFLMKKTQRIIWTHTKWFDDIVTLVGVIDLLYDDDDHLWSLTCYGTHEHFLGMMKKSMKTWNP